VAWPLPFSDLWVVRDVRLTWPYHFHLSYNRNPFLKIRGVVLWLAVIVPRGLGVSWDAPYFDCEPFCGLVVRIQVVEWVAEVGVLGL